MKVALDTNILAYAEGINGQDRASRARAALAACAADEFVVPVQALAELFTVLTRKAMWQPAQACAAVLSWQASCTVVETTTGILVEAMNLSELHQFSLWDAIMLVAAAESSCRLLLSEDMHSGFLWRGVEIRNPFQ